MSEHFSLQEATFSDTAVRNGISNAIPSTQVMRNVELAMSGMEAVRSMLGDKPIRVNSWLRVEALEKIVAAKDYAGWCIRHGRVRNDTSWAEYFARKGHPQGFCVDFTCAPFGPPAAIVRQLTAHGLVHDQLICEGTWVHVSFDPRSRKQVLTATFDAAGIPTYTGG